MNIFLSSFKIVSKCLSSYRFLKFNDWRRTESTIRLSKFVAGTGLCSRREAEVWIMDGRVMVNGTVNSSVKQFISPENDAVYVDGMKIRTGVSAIRPRIWLAKKPAGELGAHEDPLMKRNIIFDRLRRMYKEVFLLKPIYRLGYNVEGLILLSNDGNLSRMLDNNVLALPRYFRVKVHGKVTDSKLDGFKRGPTVDGVKYRGMDVTVDRTSNTLSWLKITCYENKVYNFTMKLLFHSYNKYIMLTDECN